MLEPAWFMYRVLQSQVFASIMTYLAASRGHAALLTCLIRQRTDVIKKGIVYWMTWTVDGLQ